MSDLVDVDTAAEWLGIDASIYSTTIERMITACSQHIINEIGYDPLAANHIEVLDGTGASIIFPKNIPVNSVSSLKISGVDVPVSTDLKTGYLINDKHIKLIGLTTTKGLGNVVISYNAGYTTIPTPLSQACLDLVKMVYTRKDRAADISSMSISGIGVSYNQFKGAMPEHIKAMIAPYIRLSI